jgi:polar amino acid transport system permease protein
MLTVIADFGSYFLSTFLWNGAFVAVQITVFAMALGLIFGLVLAMMRLSRLAVVRGTAWTYGWVFRGTPQLLQLVFIFDVLPVIGVKLAPITTAIIGFGLNQAAFSAESIRGGILSVSTTQTAAAASLGMGPILTLRRIVLPQAARVIVPSTCSDVISMLKLTAIASIIFVQELTFRAQQIVGQNFKFFTVFAAAGLIYLLMTSIIAVIQSFAEERLDPDRRRSNWREDVKRFLGISVPGQSDSGLNEADQSLLARSHLSLHETERKPSWLHELVSFELNGKRGASFVECKGVQKLYGTRTVLQGINLNVSRGEVVVIIGPSGSGKSTLLRMINHLEEMDGGEITVDGKHVGYEKSSSGKLKPIRNLSKARAEAKIGMVFQSFNLFSHLTALENIIEAPIHVHRVAPDRARNTALRLLAEVGLKTHAHHLPHHLSGGQQQRVAIARALAISPHLMLFDEPTSSLDPELVGEVLAVIRKLADAGMTMIIVTHEMKFAREVADRIIFMDEGRVVEEGSPERLLDAPRQERTRRFLRTVVAQPNVTLTPLSA